MSELDPIFVTVKEAAHALAVSTWKIYELLNAGELSGKYIGTGRKVYYSSVREYAERLPEERSA